MSNGEELSPAPPRVIVPDRVGGSAVADPGVRLERPRSDLRALEAVPPQKTRAFGTLRFNMRLAAVLFLGFLVIPLVLMTRLSIAGAVIGMGTLVVESGNKQVQHTTGGIIDEVYVENGSIVEAGQQLIMFDRGGTEAQLRALETNLVEQTARLDRLRAERDGRDAVTASEVFDLTLVSPDTIEPAYETERMRRLIRSTARDSQRKQLQQRIEQELETATSLRANLAANEEQVARVRRELTGLRKLLAQKVVTRKRVSDLEAVLAEEIADGAGFRASLTASASKITELELAVANVEQAFRAQLTEQIAVARTASSELRLAHPPLKRLYKDLTLRAPVAGVVEKLGSINSGTVVAPGQTVLEIVPVQDTLVGEVRLRPSDIDQIYPGQDATLTFSAFDRGTTPQLNGNLSSVTSDLDEDPRTGDRFYMGRVEFDRKDLSSDLELKLVPGMPIEVFIRTEQRSIMSYLTKPLYDQFNRSFR